MSTGWATIYGNRVEYILRMPKYELPPGKDPTPALFSHIRFSSGFETGKLTASECHDDPTTVTYVCGASYQFPDPVERLSVDCSFYEITVPNHIHMLHADRSGKSDQAILDSTFSTATLAFRPPTEAELMAQQSGAGAFRVWTNWAMLLLLLAIALAARDVREFLTLAAAFGAGLWVGTAALLRTAWQPSPRFTEAAIALALAYLALEILVFPRSRGRWVLALVFGAFAGMYFAQFVADSGYRFIYVLSGATVAALLTLGAGGLAGWAVSRNGFPDVLSKIVAAGLLLTGSVWFIVRLRG
jgi:hypothetical protein